MLQKGEKTFLIDQLSNRERNDITYQENGTMLPKNNQTIIDFQKFKERITLLNEVYNIKDKAPHIRYVLYKETY